MSAAASSTSSSTSTATPVFIRIDTNGDYRMSDDGKKAPFALRIDAFANRTGNQRFTEYVNPQEPVSEGVVEQMMRTGEMGLKADMDLADATQIVNESLKTNRVFSTVMKDFVTWAGPSVTLIDHKFYHGAKATQKREAERSGTPTLWEREDLDYKIFDMDWFWKSACPDEFGTKDYRRKRPTEGDDNATPPLEEMCRIMDVRLENGPRAGARDLYELWGRVTSGSDPRELYKLMRGPRPGRHVADAVKRNLPKVICVLLDFEATGLLPTKFDGDYPKIIEVAVKVFGSKLNWATLVNPEMAVPQKAQEITGITDRMLVGTQPWRIHGKMFNEKLMQWSLFGMVKVLLMAQYGHRYDHKLLRHEQKLVGLKLPKFVRPADSYDYFKRMFPDLPSHSMDFMREHFKLPKSRAHRALDDVLDMEKLLRLTGEGLTGEQWEQVMERWYFSRVFKGKAPEAGWAPFEAAKMVHELVTGEPPVPSLKPICVSPASSSASSSATARPKEVEVNQPPTAQYNALVERLDKLADAVATLSQIVAEQQKATEPPALQAIQVDEPVQVVKAAKASSSQPSGGVYTRTRSRSRR